MAGGGRGGEWSTHIQVYEFKWGPVIRLTAMVLVFGDQGLYVRRMHMRMCWCHNLNSGIVSGFRVGFRNLVAGGL
jgi:hypothetical protein